jgi:hypothetical protein
MQKILAIVGAAFLALLLAGCALPRAAKVPMDSIVLQRSEVPSKTLIVFMPGAFEVPADIVREGFVEQVRARNIDADVVVIDAHIGYFLGRTFDVRIQTDIIEPARKKGYQSLWLAGISLGGFGSLMMPFIYPDQFDGVIAIAPFIASNLVLNEVVLAGGLPKWQPDVPLVKSEYQKGLLNWLKGYGDVTQKRPKLYIGYGDADGMPQFDKVLGGLLAEEQLLRAPGKHDWPPWKQMWGDALDRAPLPRLGAK